MDYVLLGKLNPEWVNKKKRVEKSKEKLNQLGIALESVHYTQGTYDFVDVVSTDDPEAMVAFSVWYVAQKYGSFVTLPAFDSETFDRILDKV
ncbi:MAG: GYD domain-containing protein [Proteobacteria bacterium]|nr:GYD domain-containing protein [Pseudomonadota bacterium]